MNAALLHAAIQDAPWSEESTADFLRAAARADIPAGERGDVVERAKGQRHAILAIAGERVGTLVYEVDRGELYVTALVAAAPGRVDLLATFYPHIEALARRLGCASLRFGTSRPGMVEAMKRYGYRVAEVFMRKEIE